MLLKKPEGMCTVAADLEAKTVTIGFLTPEAAQNFRNQLVDKVIEENQGSKKEVPVDVNRIITACPSSM